MIKELLQGRLFGHPVHPMLVHFPTALFTASILFDITGVLYSAPDFILASFYCLGAGLAGGLAAGLFGFIDYIKLGNRETVFKKASWHGAMQFCVLSAFGILFLLRFRDPGELQYPETGELVAGAFFLIVMLIGNYLGGDLVFRHGVGVEENNNDEEGI